MFKSSYDRRLEDKKSLLILLLASFSVFPAVVVSSEHWFDNSQDR